jgi:hypothetical protein
VIAKSGCPIILLAILWLSLLVQIYLVPNTGTPDFMNRRISEHGCDITAAAGWLWPDEYKKQGHTLHISDLYKIIVNSRSQEQKIPATNNLHEPQLRLPYSHPVLL